MSENLKVEKHLNSLPAILSPNTVYLVKVGTELDIYVSDILGTVAFKASGVGKSAYQSALDGGFVGTEAAWVASLTPTQAGVVVVSYSFVASETLTEGMVVNIWNDAGVPKARKADASVENKHAHGFVTTDVALGDLGVVYFAGVNDKCTGLVIGDQYLSVTPGITSPFTPNMSGHVLQTIGLAISATTLFFNPSDAATLA